MIEKLAALFAEVATLRAERSDLQRSADRNYAGLQAAVAEVATLRQELANERIMSASRAATRDQAHIEVESLTLALQESQDELKVHIEQLTALTEALEGLRVVTQDLLDAIPEDTLAADLPLASWANLARLELAALRTP